MSFAASFGAPGWSRSPAWISEALPTARTTIPSKSRRLFPVSWTSGAVTAFAFSRSSAHASSGRPARLATVVTLAVFMVPHRAWGSQVGWSKLPPPR